VKLAPEVFDPSFRKTPRAFYVELEKNLDDSLASLKSLTSLCEEKFTDDRGPSFGQLRKALEEVHNVVQGLLDRKGNEEAISDPVAAASGKERPDSLVDLLQMVNELSAGSQAKLLALEFFLLGALRGKGAPVR